MAYKLRKDVKWKRIGDESLLLIPKDGEFYKINGVGTIIFESLSDGKDVEDIAKLISSSFEVDAETASKDIAEFIDDMKDKKIIL